MASFFDNKARAAAAAAKTGIGGSSSANTSSQNHNTQLQPWVEKYRPRTLDDVASQDHTTSLLQKTLHSTNLPHLLFYGPPGTGKTSTVLALSKQLFGPELFRSRVLELNASDERGISIVRTNIKDFARQQLSVLPAGPAGEAYRRQFPCPPFKIIVLDEADSMTQDAQSALRRTMETYSRITRFCLICNYVTRIIDPLASRCSKFRFKSLDSGDATTRIDYIAAQENVRLEEGATAALVKCSEGDMRRAITYLQSAARLVGAGAAAPAPAKSKKKKVIAVDDEDDEDDMDIDGEAKQAISTDPITVQIVQEIAGVIPESVISQLAEAMRPASRAVVGTFSAIATCVTNLVADGWSATQLTSQLFARILHDETIKDANKNQILAVFSEADKRLIDGADEHLIMLDLCLRVSSFMT